MQKIEFFVAGQPEQKGSTRAFVVKGRPVITSSNKNLKQWELRVAHEAQVATPVEGNGLTWVRSIKPFYDPTEKVQYKVMVKFAFKRPVSAPKKLQANAKRPDIDKLLRAVLDGLNGIILMDDAQVTAVYCEKVYGSPGATIMVLKASVEDKPW